MLAEFGSAVEAVSCAMALQEELSSRSQSYDLQVRIGIHIGDVVDKDGDLFGTAVNIAARLEGIAQPGGIVVSAAVRDAMAGKLPASFTDLGLKTLKNIEEPLRAYALSPRTGSALAWGTPCRGSPPVTQQAVHRRPAIRDLSGDRDQEYFADGIVEEIITALSRMRWLFVIARNSSFAYKGRAVDVKQIGRELGVRYVLEGSVRKAGKQVADHRQLIDTSTGAHLWADHFDGALETSSTYRIRYRERSGRHRSETGAGGDRASQAQADRKAGRLRLLSARHGGLHQWTREANAEALSIFYRAIELDPTSRRRMAWRRDVMRSERRVVG